jgi:type IV secretion system protein VirB10
MKKRQKTLIITMLCAVMAVHMTTFAEEPSNTQAGIKNSNTPSIMPSDHDPNEQNEKISFMGQTRNEDFLLHSTIQTPYSKYQLMAGTIIPGIMITGINSDLPGQIMGQVSQNIYDTNAGKYLLIPIGTKIIGIYDSKVTFGQERVMVVWNRLIFPNGKSVGIGNMTGTDIAGYNGFHDKVDNHNGRIATAVIVGSLFTAGATMATGNNSNDTSFNGTAGSGMAQGISNAATKLLEKNLNIQPTVIIRPGYQFNIFLNKDIILEPYGE